MHIVILMSGHDTHAHRITWLIYAVLQWQQACEMLRGKFILQDPSSKLHEMDNIK